MLRPIKPSIKVGDSIPVKEWRGNEVIQAIVLDLEWDDFEDSWVADVEYPDKTVHYAWWIPKTGTWESGDI